MEFERYEDGIPSWVDLGSTDLAKSREFYGALFGWNCPEGPPEAGGYSVCDVGGKTVAGLGPQMNPDMPPVWMTYVNVDSADATAAKVSANGGTVLAPPMDVMEAGRMAIVQDPTGAIFCPWQPNKNAGIGIAQVHGTLCWADLSTPDTKRASEFYSGLFGWQIAADPKDPSGYMHIKNGEHFIGGVPPAAHRQPGVPPHWMAYFQVDDVDVTANKAKEMGAQLYLAPMTMEGVGRMSVIADPQGAVFSIFKSAR